VEKLFARHQICEAPTETIAPGFHGLTPNVKGLFGKPATQEIDPQSDHPGKQKQFSISVPIFAQMTSNFVQWANQIAATTDESL
jgi:hypothetical protein